MDIYVCFGRDNGCKSRLICAVTESELSHAWIEYPSEVWEGRWVAHSTARGVIKEHQPNVRVRYPIHRIYKCNADLRPGLRAVREHIGKSDYDFGVIWNGIVLLVYRVIRWQKLYDIAIHNTAKISCSEFVALILKAAKIPGAEDIDTELTTTKTLEKIVCDSGLFELIEEAPAKD